MTAPPKQCYPGPRTGIHVLMPRPRKIITALAVTAGAIALVLGLLRYKFSENISPQMRLRQDAPRLFDAMT